MSPPPVWWSVSHIHIHSRCGNWRDRIRHIFGGINLSEMEKPGFCVIWNKFNDLEGTGESIRSRNGC